VIWPAESIYGGTWGSDGAPLEVLHFELMREMGWTFADLMATPAYVTRYCTDLMLIRRQAEADQAERQQQDAERQAHSG
jgi:hypothetical protein